MCPHQAEIIIRLDVLHEKLVAIEDLIRQFNAYRLSYDKLLVEIDRRRRYKEGAENFVRDMMAQLETMSEGVFSYLIILYVCSDWPISQRNEQFVNHSM